MYIKQEQEGGMNGKADVLLELFHFIDGTSWTHSLRNYSISRVVPQSQNPENDSTVNGLKTSPQHPCPGLHLSDCPLKALLTEFKEALANSSIKP